MQGNSEDNTARGVGRPALENRGDLKTETISISFSKTQLCAVKALANKLGKPLSACMRESLLRNTKQEREI
jgi:hypothetical protein